MNQDNNFNYFYPNPYVDPSIYSGYNSIKHVYDNQNNNELNQFPYMVPNMNGGINQNNNLNQMPYMTPNMNNCMQNNDLNQIPNMMTNFNNSINQNNECNQSSNMIPNFNQQIPPINQMNPYVIQQMMTYQMMLCQMINNYFSMTNMTPFNMEEFDEEEM